LALILAAVLEGCVGADESYIRDLKCPDGGLALTPTLYSKGFDAYKNVHCIPDYAFCQRNGHKVGDEQDFCKDGKKFTADFDLLNGLELLNYVGDKAFDQFGTGNNVGQTVNIKGNFPKLISIGIGAFLTDSSTHPSSIDLSGASAIETIGENALQVNYDSSDHKYRTIVADGTYPNYRGCGENGGFQFGAVPLTISSYRQGFEAYKEITCIPKNTFCWHEQGGSCTWGSTAVFDLRGLKKLKYIGGGAFLHTKGGILMEGDYPALLEIAGYSFANIPARITVSGSFPLLVKIGGFESTGTFDSLVNFDNAPNLRIVAAGFKGFKGQVSMKGPYPKLVAIEAQSFYQVGTKGKSTPGLINLNEATALQKLHYLNFYDFVGVVTATGSYSDFIGCLILPNGNVLHAPDALPLTYPLYTQGYEAYVNATCIPTHFYPKMWGYGVDSPIAFTLTNMPKLKSIGRYSFYLYKGTIILNGTFPSLTFVDDYSFTGSGTSESFIDIQCRGPSWWTTTYPEGAPFAKFKGDRGDARGEGCACSDCSGTCATMCLARTFTSTTITSTSITTRTVTTTTITTTTTYVPGECNGVSEVSECGTKIGKAACYAVDTVGIEARKNCPIMCGIACTSTSTISTTTTSTTRTQTTTTTRTSTTKTTTTRTSTTKTTKTRTTSTTTVTTTTTTTTTKSTTTTRQCSVYNPSNEDTYTKSDLSLCEDYTNTQCCEERTTGVYVWWECKALCDMCGTNREDHKECPMLVDLDASSIEPSGGLTLAGKITIPLGIIGFIAGLLIGWYRIKSDKKAKQLLDDELDKLRNIVADNGKPVQNPMFTGEAGGGYLEVVDDETT
jgi:hypothetical protein